MSIGRRVREARLYAQLSQEQLAGSVGVKQGTISELEMGQSKSSTHLIMIAHLCKVDPFWLLTGQGEPPALDEFCDMQNCIELGTISIDTVQALEVGETAKFVIKFGKVGLDKVKNYITDKLNESKGKYAHFTVREIATKNNTGDWDSGHIVGVEILAEQADENK